jgi:hypothetical protein
VVLYNFKRGEKVGRKNRRGRKRIRDPKERKDGKTNRENGKRRLRLLNQKGCFLNNKIPLFFYLRKECKRGFEN